MQPTEFIWRDGKFIPWAEATTHVMSHVLHYGSSVFEGIRAYETPMGTRYFRLACHLRRLMDSARIYQMPMQWTEAELSRACKDLLLKNGMTHAYVRPLVYRGYGQMGLDPTHCPVETIVASWYWGKYLGAAKEGVDVCVVSWRRLAPNTMPSLAKAGGNYLSSQLIRLEAKRHGYAEGIALTADGFVGEGSGENLFLARDGVLYTPDAASSILLGITRETVITLARSMGLEVREARVPREMLHCADEVFMCGTAAEITPVRSIDRIPVGRVQPGPITAAIQERFFGLFAGTTKDEWGWLEPLA